MQVNYIILCLYTCSQGNEDIEQQVEALQVHYPYLAVAQMDATLNVFIVAKKVVICKAKSVLQATKLLLAAYYTFHVAYPKYLGGFFYYIYTLHAKHDNFLHYFLLYAATKLEF